jgi:CBS domain containing-hemolysin-like protein
MPPEYPLFVVCLFMSAFFSGSETALMSANRLRLHRLAGDGDRSARRILDLVHDPRRLLAGILVGNNIFNVLAASTATALCQRHLGAGASIAIATAASTVMLVLFSEFLPKTLAALDPIAFSRRVATPVAWALRLLKPAVAPLEALTRPLGALLRRSRHGFGLAELRVAVAEGVRTGAVDETMARVLRGGLSLEWKTAGDVLIPRVDISAVEAEADYETAVAAFRHEQFSRLLVQDETPDADVGYLAIKDLTLLPPAERAGWTARQGAREALRIPAAVGLPDLLARMRRSGVHFAVVKDEYGGTEGIVTLEDVLEELVGEIRDEHDLEEIPPVIKLRPNQWLVRGDVSVKDLNDRLELRLDADEARTIGGLVAQELGRVPRRGDAIEVGSCRIVAAHVEDNRVLSARVEKKPTADS